MDKIYAYPASYKAAEIHKRATQLGYNSKTMYGKEPGICPDG